MNSNQDDLVEYGFRRIIITITCILCALLEIVDTTIVNVALNNMRGSLGATLSDVAWVITAYAIANVIVIPMTSWLSQQFGRKNYFATSIVIFTVASFLCGNATNIWELVAFRFIQGLARSRASRSRSPIAAASRAPRFDRPRCAARPVVCRARSRRCYPPRPRPSCHRWSR